MTEPCLICCPLDHIPERLLDFVTELRAERPATILQGRVDPDGPLAARAICWNCAGRGQVDVPNVVEAR